jgi:hypothetical protein
VVEEDVGRIWPPPKPYLLHLLSPLRWCAYLESDDLPQSVVIANGWTRRRAITKARELWFEAVRFGTEDEDCGIYCTYVPARDQQEEAPR